MNSPPPTFPQSYPQRVAWRQGLVVMLSLKSNVILCTGHQVVEALAMNNEQVAISWNSYLSSLPSQYITHIYLYIYIHRLIMGVKNAERFKFSTKWSSSTKRIWDFVFYKVSPAFSKFQELDPTKCWSTSTTWKQMAFYKMLVGKYRFQKDIISLQSWGERH